MTNTQHVPALSLLASFEAGSTLTLSLASEPVVAVWQEDEFIAFQTRKQEFINRFRPEQNVYCSVN